MVLKYISSSTLDGSCRILFSILIWCPYNLDTLFTCCFYSSLLSITTPRHLVVLVYSMIVLSHLTGGKGPTRLCFCKISTSDLPLYEVNFYLNRTNHRSLRWPTGATAAHCKTNLFLIKTLLSLCNCSCFPYKCKPESKMREWFYHRI